MYLSIIPSMTTAQPPTSPSFLHLMLDQSSCSTNHCLPGLLRLNGRGQGPELSAAPISPALLLLPPSFQLPLAPTAGAGRGGRRDSCLWPLQRAVPPPAWTMSLSQCTFLSTLSCRLCPELLAPHPPTPFSLRSLLFPWHLCWPGKW